MYIHSNIRTEVSNESFKYGHCLRTAAAPLHQTARVRLAARRIVEHGFQRTVDSVLGDLADCTKMPILKLLSCRKIVCDENRLIKDLGLFNCDRLSLMTGRLNINVAVTHIRIRIGHIAEQNQCVRYTALNSG